MNKGFNIDMARRYEWALQSVRAGVGVDGNGGWPSLSVATKTILRDAGLVVEERGICRLSPSAEEWYMAQDEG